MGNSGCVGEDREGGGKLGGTGLGDGGGAGSGKSGGAVDAVRVRRAFRQEERDGRLEIAVSKADAAAVPLTTAEACASVRGVSQSKRHQHQEVGINNRFHLFHLKHILFYKKC